MKEVERYRGSFLGLAVGDALGAAVEFMAPGSFPPVNNLIGGGPFDLPAGAWTDDTSMALCLAESLLERGGFDPRDQMERYLAWYRRGHLSSTGVCFDIGNTVQEALEKFAGSGEPFCGSNHPHSAGNGSLMRLAPVPLFYATKPRKAIHKAAESSRTTHGAKEAVDACYYMAGLLVGAVGGFSKEEILSAEFAPIPDLWREVKLSSKISEIASGSFKRRNPPQIRGTGYVVDCLEAALWAFYHGDNFREGVLLAVNLGDDADTTAAVYGQLAGAYYGEAGIPAEWLAKLIKGELIKDYAERIYEFSRLF